VNWSRPGRRNGLISCPSLFPDGLKIRRQRCRVTAMRAVVPKSPAHSAHFDLRRRVKRRRRVFTTIPSTERDSLVRGHATECCSNHSSIILQRLKKGRSLKHLLILCDQPVHVHVLALPSLASPGEEAGRYMMEADESIVQRLSPWVG